MKTDEIAIDLIVEDEVSVRSEVCREGLEKLSDSIKNFGVIEPIIVIQDGEKYILVAGYRRYTAAKMAGLVTIPARMMIHDPLKMDMIRLEENLHREEVNPVDEGNYYMYLNTQHKMSLEELSQRTGRSDTYISRRVKLVSLPEDVKGALTGGIINIGVAEGLAKIDDGDERNRLLRCAIEGGVTVRTVNLWVSEYGKRKGQVQYKLPTVDEGAINREQPNPEYPCSVCHKPGDPIKLKIYHLCPECVEVLGGEDEKENV